MPSHAPDAQSTSERSAVALPEFYCPFCRLFVCVSNGWPPCSAALFDRLRFSRGIMAIAMRGIGLVCRVLVVLGPVVFLSGAFGHRTFPFFGSP